MTSNCQFDLNLSLPTLSKSQKGQTSILSESASESQSLTNEMSGKKALKKIFEKLKEERVFDKKTRQAIIAFHYKYGDTDVYGRLKSDFWVHSKKSLQNIIDPR